MNKLNEYITALKKVQFNFLNISIGICKDFEKTDIPSNGFRSFIIHITRIWHSNLISFYIKEWRICILRITCLDLVYTIFLLKENYNCLRISSFMAMKEWLTRMTLGKFQYYNFCREYRYWLLLGKSRDHKMQRSCIR